MSARSRWKTRLALTAAVVVLLAAGLSSSFGQDSGRPPVERKGLWDFILAGKTVGFVIILLSFVAVAVVIDSFIHIRSSRLLPPNLVAQADQLAGRGRFTEILNLCRATQSMFSRVMEAGLAQGTMGLPAVRQAMQDQGLREITRLNQRVGYLGLIASVAPMLGLLGTVTGMIGSFNIMGQRQGAARPDELAIGISEALVTTCEGLILAVPLMFCHNYLRDRVSRVGQEASGICDRLLRAMGRAIEMRVAMKASAPAGAMPLAMPSAAVQAAVSPPAPTEGDMLIANPAPGLGGTPM